MARKVERKARKIRRTPSSDVAEPLHPEVAKVELRYSNRYKAAVSMVYAVGLGLLVLSGIDWLDLVISLLLGGLGCYDVFLSKVVVDDRGIKTHFVLNFNPPYHNFSVRWQDVDRIDSMYTREAGGGYRLTLFDGKAKGTIKRRMTGMAEFAIIAKRNLPHRKWQWAFDD